MMDTAKEWVFSIFGFISVGGMRVVGKGSWKDREVGEFLVGEFFPSSSFYMGYR